MAAAQTRPAASSRRREASVAVGNAPHPLRRLGRQQPPQPRGGEPPVDQRAERSPADAQRLVARCQRAHAGAVRAVAQPAGSVSSAAATPQGGEDRLVLGRAAGCWRRRSRTRSPGPALRRPQLFEPGHLEIGAHPRAARDPERGPRLGVDGAATRSRMRTWLPPRPRGASGVVQAVEPGLRDRLALLGQKAAQLDRVAAQPHVERHLPAAGDLVGADHWRRAFAIVAFDDCLAARRPGRWPAPGARTRSPPAAARPAGRRRARRPGRRGSTGPAPARSPAAAAATRAGCRRRAARGRR